MKSKRYARADKDVCAACGACMDECPRGAIEILQGCYASVNEAMCLGCGKCAAICPAGAIEIMDREG